ncbi:MAG: hypothetical protein AAFY60_21850, partial [Myxococcota bacterium]
MRIELKNRSLSRGVTGAEAVSPCERGEVNETPRLLAPPLAPVKSQGRVAPPAGALAGQHASLNLSDSSLAAFPSFIADTSPNLADPAVGELLASVPSEERCRFVDAQDASARLRELFGDSRFPLFVYGSLADRKSAQSTVEEKVAASRDAPAVALDLRRTFTKDVGKNLSQSRYSTAEERSSDNPFRASLNARRHPDATTNGVLRWVRYDDLASLVVREEGYDLIPIRVETQLAGEEPKEIVAYTFSVESKAGRYEEDRTVLPRPGYLATVQSGMAALGDSALQTFLDTTYLADGRRLRAYVDACDSASGAVPLGAKEQTARAVAELGALTR